MISTIASLVASTPLNANVPSPAAIDLNATTTTNYFYTTIDSQNRSSAEQNDTDSPVFPAYIRNTSVVFCVVIMCLGVIGNIMVPIVIFKSKDMRNSTNIFLVNLSVADLMVLLVCTPTVLVEVNSKPETWVLGETMCKAVPFVEMTVAHASVLTILAISFERYYAICKPLKAGYVCTKTRASLICLLAWFFAAVFTSPILSIAEFKHVEYFDRTSVPACHTLANSFWSALYFLMTIFIFFIIPLILLLIIYAIIAKNLISDAAKIVLNKHIDNYSIRARRQVVLMLGTVVLSFFLCLIPFRVFTVWIILVSDETVNRLGIETYYNILYFCRIMVYLNSVVNPILYNLMSSKFREGFLLCSKNRKLYFRRSRNGTLSTTVNSYRSSTFRSQGSFRTRHQSMVLKNVSDSPDSNRSNDSRTIFTESLRSNLEGSKNLEPPERGRLDSVEIQHLELSENRSNFKGSKILEPFLKHERLDLIEIQHVNLKSSNDLDHLDNCHFRSNFESVLQCSSNVKDSFKKSNSSITLELLESKTYDRSKLDAIEIQHLAPLDEGDLKFLNMHLEPISLEPAARELGEFSSNVLRISQFENQNKILKTSKHKSSSSKILTTIENLKTFEEDLYLKEMFKNKNPNMESESFV